MRPGKKRGLGQPHEFRNKPFRSPLRAVSQVQPPPKGRVQGADTPHSRETCRSPLGTTSDVAAPASSTSAPTTRIETVNLDPQRLQKQRSALIIRLSKARQALDTAQQALEIERSNQNAELQTLIAQWRTIAQQAAEEVFAEAKERIDVMGGLAAWRRRAEEDAQWRRSPDESDTARHDRGDDLNESDAPRRLSGTVTQKLGALQEDDDLSESSFTMEMMLKQMNIDLQAIGFDKNAEWWVE